jgi:hypothetical protein
MSDYDKLPIVSIQDAEERFRQGWAEVMAALEGTVDAAARVFVLAIEVYPGIDVENLAKRIEETLRPAYLLRSEDVFLPAPVLKDIFAETLIDDPVFNFMLPWSIDAYFDLGKLEQERVKIAATRGIVLIVGAGASHIVENADVLVSANVGRWEIQRRQRAHRIGNLGFDNAGANPSELYKTAFFLDWRVADRCRHEIYRKVDFFLDMTNETEPKMLPGEALRGAVAKTVRQPFRVVPFFDPGPWGGQWMRKQFELPEGPQNYAWGFDCVPEENSVLLGFGERHFELPAIVLVHEEPQALLGEMVVQRFGAEFPIRFDFLDTVGGGNLSLQVHPSEAYIREHFGMPYTQDESYYMLHCEADSSMCLGLKDKINCKAMRKALYAANAGGEPFPAGEYIAQWPTRKHDHFSIPAGTVHCSGEGNVVLEISATPYIFTFKLWDWGRTGLDGLPRPIHLQDGLANIRWDRTTEWVREELVGQTKRVQEGDGWLEERTGLHATQFLETRRYWFTKPIPQNTCGNLHVLNLVEGSEAIVRSPTGAFAPMSVHYAETFIVPAIVGEYVIEPTSPKPTPTGVLKAYVRP